MAKDPETIPVKPSLSDTNARDNFISVALREIISDQLTKGRWNHEQAAVLSVRYANAVMAARGNETAPLKVVVSKGEKTVPQLSLPPLSQNQVTDDDGNVVGKQPPKSIAEIIGEAEPVAEVK